MIRVGCAPDPKTLPANIDVPFILYKPRPSPEIGAIGNQIPSTIAAMKLQPSARAWDFLSIALAVVAADEGCGRESSSDGWTRNIHLTIAVVDAPFWSSVATDLERALQFVTGDVWSFTFLGGGFLPTPPKESRVRPEDLVCLLSGGMDSLVGALDAVASGRSPFLVSQVAKGDKGTQRKFATIVAPKCQHLQVNHNASPPGVSERSQRGRSIVFFGLGVLAATCLASYPTAKYVDLWVPENGFISFNVPLTPMRLGSLSTRTTHPYYLSLLQSILDTAGLKVKLKNPYQYLTKGEMLSGCKNQTLLKQLIGEATSCGRYARSGFQQCGRCVPCLVRRGAFLKWGFSDPTPGYKYAQLGTPDSKHRDFDDVRSAAIAIHTVKTRGLDTWIGGALNSAQIGPVVSARDVVSRGLQEVEKLLTVHGVL